MGRAGEADAAQPDEPARRQAHIREHSARAAYSDTALVLHDAFAGSNPLRITKALPTHGVALMLFQIADCKTPQLDVIPVTQLRACPGQMAP